MNVRAICSRAGIELMFGAFVSEQLRVGLCIPGNVKSIFDTDVLSHTLV